MIGQSRYQGRAYAPFQRPVASIKRVAVTTPPTEFPITLDEAKIWLGITDDASNDLIEGLIQAATQNIEEYTRRAIVEQGITMTLDAWPSSAVPAIEGYRQGSRAEMTSGAIDLLRPALISITEVRYFDNAGTATIYPASNYFADNSDPNQYGRLVLQPTATAPTSIRNLASWEIEYVAGYGPAPMVPFAIKQAIQQLVAYLFTKRGDCADGDGINSRGAVLNPIEASGAAGILEPYRILRL